MFVNEDKINLNILIDRLDIVNLIDISYHEKIFKRILRENNSEAFQKILDKDFSVLSFIDEEGRNNLINLYTKYLKSVKYKRLHLLLSKSKFGNILYISIFFENNTIINFDNISIVNSFNNLDFIEDSIVWYYIPSENLPFLNLDERLNSIIDKLDPKFLIRFFEKLFFNDLIKINRDFINSMLILYNFVKEPNYILKRNILASIISGNKELFIDLIKKIIELKVMSIDDIKEKYYELYNALLELGIPIYFNYEFIISDDKIFNNNAWFMLILQKNGSKLLIDPYSEINVNLVQQIYDPYIRLFVTPSNYIGECKIFKIFSFKEIEKIKNISNEEKQKVQILDENEIELKIRIILGESNKTSHAPTERLDVWPHKLYINNNDDIRDGGIIIKGKSYKKVFLKDVSTNIIKGMDEPISLIILIYIGFINDEVKHYFIKECNAHNKLYTFVDLIDLTKLFKAYNVLE